MTLKALNVAKSFGEKLVIREVTAEVPQGRLTLFSGPSGIGKSTLLEILSGLMKPSHGHVLREGTVSYLFQDNALVPWLSSRDNLAYVFPEERASERENKIRYWLDFFELPEGSLPHELSGGMRRRLNLARTFLAERPNILLDEPFAFLDDGWITKLSLLILERIRDGAAIAMAAHGLSDILREALGGLVLVHELNESPISLVA